MSTRPSKPEAYMPLFVGDFLAATAEWAGEDQALYLLLLALQWSVGSLPADAKALRRMTRYELRSWACSWAVISHKFPVCEDGRRRNQRLEIHREYAQEQHRKRVAAGQRGAEVRYSNASSNAIAQLESCYTKGAMPSNPTQPKPEARRVSRSGKQGSPKQEHQPPDTSYPVDTSAPESLPRTYQDTERGAGR
jgi:uncharacterized protein YdaU (DUF1376 family)